MTDRHSQAALKNSVIVASVVAIVATILGTAAAYCTNRWAFRGRTAYLATVALPPCVPLLILALALLIYLNKLGLAGSLRAVILCHVVLSSAFVLGIVRMGLAEMDENLEKVAWNLGAGQWRAIREVVLPQIAPNIVAGALLAAVVSFDEFIIAWFVGGFDITFPVEIYSKLFGRVSPQVNALGTVAFAISITIVVAIECIVLVWKAPAWMRGRGRGQRAQG
jgi:spermidine/putrescine transport system permease protein